MATHFTVSDVEFDDDTLSRRADIRLGTSGDVSFQTPLKVGLGDVTEMPFYEAHKKIRPQTILDCLGSETKARVQGRDLKKRCRGAFNVLTLEYDSKTEVPTEKMVVALSDMQYNHTDAVATPSWFDLINRKNGVDVGTYLRLSGVFLEAASTRNHKPILGTIPQCIPPKDLGDVLGFYIDKDVTSFVVDSHGRTLISGSWIRTFQRSLSEYDIEGECVLYTMNAFQGTVPKTRTATEAKDFLLFTAGFDVIGGKHSSKFNPETAGKEEQTSGKVFDRSTYNYRNLACSKDERLRIGEQTIRDQNAEFAVVGEAISERSVKPLLETKDLTRETMNEILSFRQDRHRTTLDDFI